MVAMKAVIGRECPHGCELLGGFAITAEPPLFSTSLFAIEDVVFCPMVSLTGSNLLVLYWFHRCYQTPFLLLNYVLLSAFFFKRTYGAK